MPDHDTSQRLHHVLNHSAAPNVDLTLARVIHSLEFLIFIAPLFAQVLVSDTQTIGQDDAVVVVGHSAVLTKRYGMWYVAVNHVFKHTVTLGPQVNDRVVLVSVHPHDTLGFLQVNLH